MALIKLENVDLIVLKDNSYLIKDINLEVEKGKKYWFPELTVLVNQLYSRLY